MHLEDKNILKGKKKPNSYNFKDLNRSQTVDDAKLENTVSFLCLRNFLRTCAHAQDKKLRDFAGGPMAMTLRSQSKGPSLIPDQGTRSHMLQLRVCMLQLRPSTAK